MTTKPNSLTSNPRWEVVNFLGEYADDYDIDAITREAYDWDAKHQGFVSVFEDEEGYEDEEGFWALCQKHELPEDERIGEDEE